MKNIIKIVLSFISIVILTGFFTKIVFADLRPVVDNANLLTNQEINYLTEEIESFKLKYNMDAVIVTINNLEGESPQNYADNYYDYNGYGLGNEESGLILLIDMDTRKIYISTKGEAIRYFTDDRLDKIISDISEYFSNQEYFKGFSVFLDDINVYMNSGIPENQYEYSEAEKNRNVIITALLVAFITATITCVLVVKSYKSPKSISSLNYVDTNSIVFTKRKDIFINTFTTKRKIQKNNGNSGGRSSTHTSSSGDTHGGRGGSF